MSQSRQITFQNSPGIQQIEIPIQIIDTPISSPNVMQKLGNLPKILFREEQTTYNNSLNNKFVHPLVQVHSSSVYQKSLCRLLEFQALPMLHSLRQKEKEDLNRLVQLRKEKERLVKLNQQKKIKV